MRKTLMLLVASTMLTSTLGVTAWSATRPEGDVAQHGITHLTEAARDAAPMMLASGDRDDDDAREHARRGDDDHRRGHDHDDDDDDDDDDHGGGKGAARNAAPAGAVAPPANGLFGNGAAPRVQVN